MKRIFGTGIFFRIWGLLIYCGLRPPKVPLRSIPIRTSVYHCFTWKLFHVGCAQDSGNFAVFSLWPRLSWKLLECFTRATHIRVFMGFYWPPADPLYINGDMVHFGHYKKPLTFGLEPPMHRSGSNWTHKCTRCNNRSMPYFTQIGEHLGKRPKKLFSAQRTAMRMMDGGMIVSKSERKKTRISTG